MKNCSQCGTACSDDSVYCFTCGSRFAAAAGEVLPGGTAQVLEHPEQTASPPNQAASQYPQTVPVEKIPFENWKEEGFWKTLWQTWKLASLKPAEFFPAVGKSADNGSAIFFYMTVILAFFYFFFVLSLPFRIFGLALNLARVTQQSGSAVAHLTFAAMAAITLITLVATPLFVFLYFYLGAWGWHICLLIFGGAPKGFNTTLRTVAYASAPNIVPCVGGLWSLVIKIIGLARAHDVDIWKPIAAFIINLIFLALLIAGFVAILVLFILFISHSVNPSALAGF